MIHLHEQVEILFILMEDAVAYFLELSVPLPLQILHLRAIYFILVLHSQLDEFDPFNKQIRFSPHSPAPASRHQIG